MEESAGIDNCFDIVRRLSPHMIERNLRALIGLSPENTGELLATVDQPLRVKRCVKTNKEYLTCDYNRDGDSYRSPYSNEYDPPLEDGLLPSAERRELEVRMNDAFDIYRTLYFDEGLSSVYVWDSAEGFALPFSRKRLRARRSA